MAAIDCTAATRTCTSRTHAKMRFVSDFCVCIRVESQNNFRFGLQVLGHHEDVPAFHGFVTASAAQNEVHAQTLLIDAVQSFLTQKT